LRKASSALRMRSSKIANMFMAIHWRI
jgi:hypothetical protein